MDFELKRLPLEGIPHAMDKVDRYRLLNEPWEAESICLDVLAVDPTNQRALIELLLTLTDQFAQLGPARLERRAREVLDLIDGDYQRLYYAGVIAERKAKAQLRLNLPSQLAWDGFAEAMACYERAAAVAAPGDNDAILRWNTCARVIQKERLEPPDEDRGPGEHGLE